MGVCNSLGCCGERITTEFFAEPFPILESQSYRANFVHQEGVLESIEQVNMKVLEFDDMDKINKLLDTAEKRITVQQTPSERCSEVSNKPLVKSKVKKLIKK